MTMTKKQTRRGCVAILAAMSLASGLGFALACYRAALDWSQSADAVPDYQYPVEAQPAPVTLTAEIEI